MPAKISRSRLIILFVLVVCSFATLLVRLAYLQVWRHSFLTELASKQQVRNLEVGSERGKIMDRHGENLALSIEMSSVIAHPNGIKDKWTTAKTLSPLLGMKVQEILRAFASDRFVWLKRRIPLAKAQAIQNCKLTGIELIKESQRFYPQKDLACHVLGFVGNDQDGLEGVELVCNKFLKGRPGVIWSEQDAKGRMLLSSQELHRQAVPGWDVRLTLDAVVQQAAERELLASFEKYHCRQGSVIVINPKNGEILALANLPSYDPNHFSEYKEEVRRNASLSDSYEPGSTFKIITAAALLDKNLVKEDDQFFCENGKYVIPLRRNKVHVVHDHEKEQWLTFREVIEKSSNIGMVKAASRLGSQGMFQYAKLFGFGEKTGIDLPGEASGLLRPVEKWSGVSMYSIPYGQEISVTPIQLLDAVCLIANRGKKITPHIIKSVIDPEGNEVEVAATGQLSPKAVTEQTGWRGLVADLKKLFTRDDNKILISGKTCERVNEILKGVVEEGTGTEAALPGYEIAGKTGTAEKVDAATRGYAKGKYVASFIGYLPANDPQLAVLVVLDEPRGVIWGGTVAAPVFREITKSCILAMNIFPNEVTKDSTSVVEKEKPAPKEGFFARLARKMPIAQPQVFGNQKFRMPNLSGKTMKSAWVALKEYPMKLVFSGTGLVVQQFPLPGREVSGGMTCTLKFAPNIK